MARTIKQISHDLKPMAKLIYDISEHLNALIPELQKQCTHPNTHLKDHFENVKEGMQNLFDSAELVVQYIEDVEQEANLEGITKRY